MDRGLVEKPIWAVIGWVMVVAWMGCSGDEPGTEASQLDIERSVDSWLAGMEKGGLGEHPMVAMMEKCHVVDGRDLVWLLVLKNSEVDASVIIEEATEELGALMGMDLGKGGDEFDHQERMEEARAEFRERYEELTSKPLCTETHIYFDEYDFDGQMLQLGHRFGGPLGVPQVVEGGWSDFPVGDKVPIRVDMQGIDRLPMEVSAAQEWLQRLERTGSAGGGRYGEESLLFSEGPGAAWPSEVRGAIEWMEYDRLIGRSNRGGAMEVLLPEVESALEPDEGLREAEAWVVFSPGVVDARWEGESFSRDGFELQLPEVSLVARDLAVRTPGAEEVEMVWPRETEAVKAPEQWEDLDGEADRELLEALCREGLQVEVNTQMVEGELREVERLVCGSCPHGMGSWDIDRFSKVMRGGFWEGGRQGALVRTAGCQVTFFAQRGIDGEWDKVSVMDGHYNECQILSSEAGMVIPVCKEPQMGESFGRGKRVIMRPEVLSGMEDLMVGHEFDHVDQCSGQALVYSKPQDIRIGEGEGDGEQIEIDWEYIRVDDPPPQFHPTYGTEGCPALADLEHEEGEVTLRFDLLDQGVRPTEETREAMEKIQWETTGLVRHR